MARTSSSLEKSFFEDPRNSIKISDEKSQNVSWLQNFKWMFFVTSDDDDDDDDDNDDDADV